MFLFYGGSLLDIAKESPFENVIKQADDAPTIKEKTTVIKKLINMIKFHKKNRALTKQLP